MTRAKKRVRKRRKIHHNDKKLEGGGSVSQQQGENMKKSGVWEMVLSLAAKRQTKDP